MLSFKNVCFLVVLVTILFCIEVTTAYELVNKNVLGLILSFNLCLVFFVNVLNVFFIGMLMMVRLVDFLYDICSIL